MNGGRLRILVVDQDEADRLALRLALAAARLDAEVVEAASTAQALAAAALAPPDCVLFDVGDRRSTAMGAELLFLLKDARPPIDAPVIVVGDPADDPAAVALLQAGAADHIPRAALGPERLAGSIRSAVGVRRAERAVRRAETEHRRYVRKLRALTEAAPRINGTLEREPLLAAAAEDACRVLEARRAHVCVRFPGEAIAARTATNGAHAPRSAEPPWQILWDLARDAQCACRLTTRELAALSGPAGAPGGLPRGAIATPLSGHTGENIGVLVVADAFDADFGEADLAIAAQLAQTVQVALENARRYEATQRAMRACDELRAMVCHDLRSPLGSIQLGSTLLREMVPESHEVHAVMRRMDVAAGHMQQLIADFLDGARFESQGLAVVPGSVLVSELVEAAMSLSALQASAARVRLVIRGDIHTGSVRAERDRALQVLSNLLGNAVKFTPSGGLVELETALDAGEVRFTVRDTGPGIAPEHVPHVFEMFWQLGGAPREGVGLGLYIVKTIVEAHGGRIWMENGADGGAVFHFTLPAA